MDPMNNQTPTPTPSPSPSPVPEPTPAPASAPVPPVSTPEPVQPAVGPEPAVGAAPAPVSSPQPGTPAMPAFGGANPTPVNPVFQPTGKMAATDPIMRPEPAPAPDPIEEELKAPMKAADPVPGSIGSAVSGPSGMGGVTPEGPAKPSFASIFARKTAGRTPNIAFNDPATQPEGPEMAQNQMMAGQMKKKNNMTLIILIAIAAIVVVVLAVVLVMQLIGGDAASSQNSSSNSSNSSVSGNTSNNSSNNSNNNGSNNGGNSSPNSSTPTIPVVSETLSCVRNMTSDELIFFNDAISGTVTVSAEFDEEGMLASVALVKSVIYSDEDATSNEPVEAEVHEADSSKITATNAGIFYLPVDTTDEVNFGYDAVLANYESLDFVCEAL